MSCGLDEAEKEQKKEKEMEKDLTYGQWVMQRATSFLTSVYPPIAPLIKSPQPIKMEKKLCELRIQRQATILCGFLSRFPNLTIIQADKNSQVLGLVLAEVFKRKTFPTVERFVDPFFPESHFFGQVPFTIVARALPNLRMLGLEWGNKFLGSKQVQIDNFFREFTKGMFPQVRKIHLSYAASLDPLSGENAAVCFQNMYYVFDKDTHMHTLRSVRIGRHISEETIQLRALLPAAEVRCIQPVF